MSHIYLCLLFLYHNLAQIVVVPQTHDFEEFLILISRNNIHIQRD
jgi:hypothetical protein